MKKRFLLMSAFFVMLLVPGLVKAETRIGVRAGFNSVENNIESVNTETVLSENSYNGFLVGGVLQTHYKSGMGIEVACLYSQSGLVLPNEEMLKQNSLIFPISLKMFVGITEGIQLFVYGGPQLLLNVRETGRSVLDGTFSQDYVMDRAVFSVNAGAGIQLSPHFQVFANYNWQIPDGGLYSLNQTENSTVIEIGRKPINTRTLQLGTTIFF